MFAGREGRFGTIQAPDPDIFVSEPVINDSGVAAFERSFVENDLFVTQIVTGTVGGPVVPWWTPAVRSPSSASARPR